MARKRFTEREVLETLAWQGVFVACYRCGAFLFARDQHGYVKRLLNIEREHLHEVALGGADRPSNCRYSCGECHAIITNGTKATSAGSSKQRIAKVKRLRGETKTREAWPIPQRAHPWPPKGSRKMASKPFNSPPVRRV